MKIFDKVSSDVTIPYLSQPDKSASHASIHIPDKTAKPIKFLVDFLSVTDFELIDRSNRRIAVQSEIEGFIANGAPLGYVLHKKQRAFKDCYAVYQCIMNILYYCKHCGVKQTECEHGKNYPVSVYWTHAIPKLIWIWQDWAVDSNGAGSPILTRLVHPNKSRGDVESLKLQKWFQSRQSALKEW